jgi:hypothetical protein
MSTQITTQKILAFNSFITFPLIGLDGYIYIDNTANIGYLWDTVTSQYVNIGGVSGSNLEIKNEGITLTTAATSIDFIGDAVTATAVGTAVTVNVTGGGVAASTNNLFAYYNFI